MTVKDCGGKYKTTSTHWGPGIPVVENGVLKSVGAHPDDPDPSPINDNIARYDSLNESHLVSKSFMLFLQSCNQVFFSLFVKACSKLEPIVQNVFRTTPSINFPL